ncbi:MAG: DUF11 domain-containing protein [Rhodothermales bacterium]|nr:DUF11 domain-containing protein [Rhodothermales bacterium]
MLARTVPTDAPASASVSRALLLIGVLCLIVPPRQAAAQDIFVSASGSDFNSCTTSGSACRSIGVAISKATAGDVISVGAGTYAESVVVDRSVTLLGAQAGVAHTSRTEGGASESIVDASGLAVAFDIQADDVVIDGFDIVGDASTWAGVKAFGTRDNLSVRNNFIHGMANENPNSTSFSYAYGVWAIGDGDATGRGTITDVEVSANHIHDLGGSLLGSGHTSGGAGVFLFSLDGGATGTGAHIFSNRFADLADGVHTLWRQPGVGVALLQDDHSGRLDSGALVTGNTYSGSTLGVVMQTTASLVTEANASFSGADVLVAQLDGLGTVDEVALAPFNARDDEHLLVLPLIGISSKVYVPVQQTRYVDDTGVDALNLCTDTANPCRTIQWAVDRAFDDDIIEVRSGTFAETVTVNKALEINGTGQGVQAWNRTPGSAGESILDASGFEVGFDVQSDDVTIDGFEITGDATTWAGVKMFGTRSGVTVSNNNIHGFSGENPNSTSFSYSYGVWGLGDGSSAARGTLSGLNINFNRVFDLGGSALPSGHVSGGAGVFLFSTIGNDTGTGALIATNRFEDMEDGTHTLWPQPGLGVAVLQDDDASRTDTGVQITTNTYTDVRIGAVMQTDDSRVTESNGAFSGVDAFVARLDGYGTVNEAALLPYNVRDNEALLIFPASGVSSTVYYPVNQTRYVRTTGSDALNLCTDAANPCRTIQWAVDRSFAGDVIDVGAGTFAESVRVDKDITINGNRAGTVATARTAGAATESILDASGLDYGFDVASSGVTIDGFEIEGNFQTWAGIRMFGAFDGVTLQNNLIHGMGAANPNSTGFSYSYGIWGMGGGTVGNRGNLTNLQVLGNDVFDLGGFGVFNGTSGGAGVFLMGTTGANAGDGAVIAGNRFRDFADGVHNIKLTQPGVGIALGQDDDTAALDSGVDVSGNTYQDLSLGVVADVVNTWITESNASFTNVPAFVLNSSSRANVDEGVLSPYALSTSPALGFFSAPVGSVAYFAGGQTAFDNSTTAANIHLQGNLSGVGTATATQLILDGVQLVIIQNGVEIFRGSPSAVAAIIVEGTVGDDTLEIDLDLLGLLPAAGVVFNGGLGFDSMTLTGGTGITTVEHTFVSENDGSVTVDGSLIATYTGLDPILDNLSALNRIFTFTAGTETVTLSDDGVPGNNYSFIDADFAESVTFLNPTATLTVNLGAGDDTINVGAMDSGLTVAPQINGGTGSDRFNITPSAVFAFSVAGGDPTVAPGDVLDIVLAGTTGASLTNAGGSGSWTFTNRQTISFTGIETQIDDPTLADVQLTKTAGSTNLFTGDVVVFTLTLTNNGPSTASGIQVTDTLPAALICVCNEIASEGTFSSTGGSGATITWSGIGLAAGESATLQYSASVPSGGSGTTVNTASIAAASPGDPDLTNNSASVTLTFKQPIRFPTGVVVQAVAFHVNTLGQTETLAGTFNQGLYRSIPGVIGNRWAPVLGNLPANLVVNDLLVSVGGTVYMATHSYGGLHTSTDGGRSFQPVDFGGATLTVVHAMDESPVDGTVYISADDGQVWRLNGGFWDFAGRLPGGASHTPWALAADPVVAGRVFAGTFGDGVWRSDDYGETWVKVSGGALPHGGSIHIFDLEFDPELSPTTLWAATPLGIFYSQDAGVTWLDASTGLGKFKDVRSIAFGPVDPSPTATGSMYVATWGGGVFELPSDRATFPSWVDVTLRHQQVGIVAVSPDGTKLVAAPATGGTVNMALAGVTTAAEPVPAEIPIHTRLDQNYPNPFNPRTTIAFALHEAGEVTLTVHDLLGRVVATLASGVLPAGEHEVAFDAGDLPSGPYLYRLQAAGDRVDRVMVLMK